LYQIAKITVNITERDRGEFNYGSLEIKKIPFPKDSRIMCKKFESSRLSLEFIDINVTIIPYKSKFAKCIISTFFALSTEHKLNTMVAYSYNGLVCREWEIVHQDFRASLFDIFLIGLYFDLKVDIEAKDTNWRHLESLVSLLRGNVEWYFTEALAVGVTYAVLRVEKTLGLFGTNQKFIELRKQCFDLLYIHHPKDQIVRQAEEFINKHKSSEKGYQKILYSNLKWWWCKISEEK